MFIRIALTTILLAICSVHTCRGADITWATTCPIDIPEKPSKGTLMTFQATHATTYTLLTQNVTDRFTINSSSGVLSSTTNLDYESDQKAYSVQIMASNADPVNNISLTCELRVIDVNDEEPLFVKDPYYVVIVNNVAISTSLLTVSATDKDVTAEFNKVDYSITDRGSDANFTVDVHTGVIRAKTVLAAGDPVNLTLTVVATDSNMTAFTAEASVKVCLGCKISSGSSEPGMTLFASMVFVIIVMLI